ncbi:MAG: PA0069 family radical SAM protein [Geminicoccaceae bacterium]|nr:PA0069 family radical SAM protein [Geminicoccaceae bacterium]
MSANVERERVVWPAFRGRGTGDNPSGRFESLARAPVDDGWDTIDELMAEPGPKTVISSDSSRTVVARNTSPDLPFDRSVNPYRGCEHGCIYCYARPTHNWLGLSSGLDFETKILAKHDAAELLKQELAKPGYRCSPLALGTNTDPYQPAERRLGLTRAVLGVLAETRHPVGIVTKSALVLRDLDILAPMAASGLARVYLSLTTLDREIARTLEPRAAAPHRRLETMAALAAAGVPVGVMTAPIIPALTDHEIERLLGAAAEAGAQSAGYVLLRLPHDVAALFEDWLEKHYPLRRAHVLSAIRQTREGRLNDPQIGSRMRGTGVVARLIEQRFTRACARLGLNRRRMPQRTDLFRPPARDGQLDLFG